MGNPKPPAQVTPEAVASMVAHILRAKDITAEEAAVLAAIRLGAGAVTVNYQPAAPR